MTYATAVKFLEFQSRCIRKVNGIKFRIDGFEYRITYFGGFAAYVGIDRREIGKRNFKYFGGVGAHDCVTVGQVMEKIYNKIERKAGMLK